MVAIQIESQVDGTVHVEDRLVLVKARDIEEAKRRLQRVWSRYAEPYMNSAGYLVRWQLIAIRDVQELSDGTIDPRGTEVYSQIRRVRMRPEYRWHPSRARASQSFEN